MNVKNLKNRGEIVTEEGFVLKFHDRPSTEITIKLPDDTLEILEKVAVQRNMSVQALVRMYFSHGLRVDLAESFPELAKELFEKRFRNRKKNVATDDGEIDLAA